MKSIIRGMVSLWVGVLVIAVVLVLPTVALWQGGHWVWLSSYFITLYGGYIGWLIDLERE